MERSWMRAVEDGVSLDVWIVPGAARTEIAGIHDGALRIRIAVPPERGKANGAVVRLLSVSTGGTAEIVRGHRSRRKTVRIRGVEANAVLEGLGMTDSE